MSNEAEFEAAKAFLGKLGLKYKVLTLEDLRQAHAAKVAAYGPISPEPEKDDEVARIAKLLSGLDDLKMVQQLSGWPSPVHPEQTTPRRHTYGRSAAAGAVLGGTDVPQADTTTDADALLAKLAEAGHALEIRNAALEIEMQTMLQERNAATKAEAARKVNVEACIGELLRIVQNKISEPAVALTKKAERECADKALLSRLSPQLCQKRRSAPRPRTEENVKADAATDARLRSAYSRPDGIDQIAAITNALRREQSSDELQPGETTARPDQLKLNMAAKYPSKCCANVIGEELHRQRQAIGGAYVIGQLREATDEATSQNRAQFRRAGKLDGIGCLEALTDSLRQQQAAKELLRAEAYPNGDPALNKQVGGSHYKGLVIQPVEYCQRNGLGFCESSVVKYVSRYKAKNGVEDLRKARHFLDLLIEMCEKDAGATD